MGGARQPLEVATGRRKWPTVAMALSRPGMAAEMAMAATQAQAEMGLSDAVNRGELGKKMENFHQPPVCEEYLF